MNMTVTACGSLTTKRNHQPDRLLQPGTAATTSHKGSWEVVVFFIGNGGSEAWQPNPRCLEWVARKNPIKQDTF